MSARFTNSLIDFTDPTGMQRIGPVVVSSINGVSFMGSSTEAHFSRVLEADETHSGYRDEYYQY